MIARFIMYFVAFCMAVLPIRLAQAQEFPSQTIRIIVPNAPGGGTDLTARIVADKLSASLGQAVIVENRPGAASQVGISYVARSQPDGYTLLWSSADGISVLPAVKAKTSYKMPDDFEFVATLVSVPSILGVTAKLPIKNLDEFIAYVKARPGELHYSSAGAGGGGHLLTAAIAGAMGLNMAHVPFDSAVPATVAVAGGHVDFTEVAPSTLAPFVADGTVRAIATSGSKRTSLFPDLPTLAELGYPQLTTDFYYGMYAPHGTPPTILDKLRKAISAIRSDQKTVDQLKALGLEPFDRSGDEFKALVVSDLARWRAVTKAIGFQITD